MGKPLIYTSIILITFIFYFLNKDKFINLIFLQHQLNHLITYQQNHPVKFFILFEALFLILTSLSIPGSILLTLLSGVTFGKLWGSLLVTFNGALGATISFLMARYFFKSFIQHKFSLQLKKIDDSLKKNGLWYLWMMRMLPGSPFVLVNLLFGLTNIRSSSFFLITALGMFPGNYIFVYAGHRILEINSVWEILTPELIIILIGLGIIPLFFRQIRSWRSV